MHAATQVHESAWLRNERCEHIRSDNIHRQHASIRVHSRVMNHGIESTKLIRLVSDISDLLEVRHIADYGRGSAVEQILHGSKPWL